MDVASWLDRLGLGQYADAFRANDIDVELLAELSEADLERLGVRSLGHRKRLLKAIADLSEAPTPESGRPAETEPVAAPEAAPAAGAAGERRQLTVLFCDLVGSTELAQRLDPEDMGALVRAYHAAGREVVGRWEGHIAKFMGDGILAYFGYPHAHEDDAERAVRAALDLVQAVAGLSTSDRPLAARVGIATGLVMVGELIGEGTSREQSVVGETPNLAARLQALAAAGTVVIAARTRRLLGGLFELDDLGAQALKGFPEPVRAFRVVAESRAESRFEALHGRHLTPLVGREHEIGLLLDRWERAKEGEGQVVLLSGEPGIGKSRIVRALRERLGDEAYTPLSHYCSPFHVNSALHPVIGLLERSAGLARDDPPDVRLTKLENLLSLSSDDLHAVVPLVAALLGVPTGEKYPSLELAPQRQRQRTLEVLVDQVEGLARRQPVLIIHEDVHWADPTTLEILDRVIERVQRLPVLLLITFRPEFIPAWATHAHVIHLSLARLTRRHGGRMVERVTGGKALPADILEQIVERADGVPLFVEELTKSVLESGLLRDAGDHFQLEGPLPSFAIPSSLHDSLMARLDRLAAVKELAQIGAVIGREFSHDLLAAVANRPEAELAAALDRLIAAELVFRRDTPPEATYSFKHALVQGVAYQSLLNSKRQELHARVAHVLQEQFPNLIETQPEVLAHHLTAARFREQAIACWDEAGRRAVGRFANSEAIGHFTKALGLLEALPEDETRDRQELHLRVALIVPLIATHGFGSMEVERCAKRAKEISDRRSDAEHRFAVTRAVWNSSLLRRSVPETLALSSELLQLAGATGDPAQLAAAHRARGYSLYIACHLNAALDHLVQGIELADAVADPARFQVYGEHPAMVCRAYAALTVTMLGRLEQGAALSDDAVSVARRLANPHTLAWSLVVAAQDSVVRRQFEAARAQAEEAVTLAREHHLPQWLGGATVYRGCALAQAGELERGIAEMEHGVAHWLGTGAVLHSSHHRAMLAAACCEADDLERGRAHLAVALRHVDNFGERYAEAELHRIEAQLRLREGAPSQEVEAELRRAIQIAGAQGAGLWQLRAAITLADLWAERGKRQRAYDLLAPIYGWFTEGFDTRDLKDAEALLDALQ